MEKILIKNARVMDPSQNLDITADILLEDGIIAKVGEGIEAEATVIDANGLIAAPGLIDMHVHLRDPGFTHKEDILTGCMAAAAGGFTAVASMPNTKPVTDSPEVIKYILDKAKDAACRVYPVAAITKDLSGSALNDFAALKAAGAVGVSDDGRPVEKGGQMLEALKLAQQEGLLALSHCEDLTIIDGGIINKGKISEELGVKGMDRASEDSITAREIVLAECSNTRIHICHVSTKGSVQLIREAKARGVKVTAETAPHYMLMTDELLRAKDANWRMNPPLREQEDCEAVIAGVLDGTLDCIITDHAPHAAEEKADFYKAPNGIVGLETSFAAANTALCKGRGMDLMKLIDMMSCRPAQILGVPGGTLKVGAAADIVLLDPDKVWTVDKTKFHSKSNNTPFHGMELTGKAVCTICGGKITYQNF